MLKYTPLIMVMLCLVFTGSAASFQDQSVQTGEDDQIIFRDDFTGTSLRPEWKLLREDPDRWTFYENEYFLIIVTYSRGDPQNTLAYDGPLPENYEITLKVHSPPVDYSQYVAITLARDGKNQLSFRLGAKINKFDTGLYFNKYLRGEESQIHRRIGKLTSDSVYLRLRKNGINYTASYSFDGATWTKTGTHLFLNLNGRPYISVYQTEKSPEVGVYLDYVEIRNVD